MKAPHSRSGFMLIEVVLAMSILVLVTVGLYQIMQSSISAASEIRDSKVEQQQMNGFVELCRRTIGTLPNEAHIVSAVREQEGQFAPLLTIDNSPMAFSFGQRSAYYGPKSLVLIPQIGGLHSVAIEYGEDIDEERIQRTMDPPPPLVLLEDVRGMEWQFYDERSDSWMEKWEDPETRPRLVRMNLFLPGIEEPVSAVYKVPEGGVDAASLTGQNAGDGQGGQGDVQTNPGGGAPAAPTAPPPSSQPAQP